jgi:hypothetical protein
MVAIYDFTHKNKCMLSVFCWFKLSPFSSDNSRMQKNEKVFLSLRAYQMNEKCLNSRQKTLLYFAR